MIGRAYSRDCKVTNKIPHDIKCFKVCQSPKHDSTGIVLLNMTWDDASKNVCLAPKQFWDDPTDTTRLQLTTLLHSDFQTNEQKESKKFGI